MARMEIGKFEKFNTPLSKKRFLFTIRRILTGGLFLILDNKYNPKEMRKRFADNRTAWNYDVTKEIIVTTKLLPEEYLLIQDILKRITGNIWEMDRFLNLLCNWFIYSYSNLDNYPRYFPFRVKKRGNNLDQTVRFNNLNRFEKKFSKYYKNTMKSWKE